MSEFQWAGLFLFIFGIVGVYVFWVLRWKPKILEKLEPETLINKNIGLAIIIFILRFINSLLILVPDDRFSWGLFFFIIGIFGLCMLIFG